MLSLLRIWAIRVTTKPSTAKCDINTYTLFLLAESKYPGCTRLAKIMEDLSHDSVNRFLLRERYEPKDLFDEVKVYISLIGGTLSGDDTVIDKPHSDLKLTELIGFYYSGRHHRTVKEIQLITLYYTDSSGKSVPVNYRISEAIKAHFFSAIRAFTQLELMRYEELIENWYEVQRNLSLHVARDFILEHLKQKLGLNAHGQLPVNA